MNSSLTMAAIREQIRAIGVPGSAGISNQKMVAKIAIEENKPDGQFLVEPDAVYDYIGALPLKKIPGVGPKSLERLQQHGLYEGRDIQRIELVQLQQILGDKAGYVLHERCAGHDPRQVITERIRKSVGVEETLSADMHQLANALRFLEDFLLPKLRQRLRVDRWQQAQIKTQTVKLKFADFTQTTVSKSAKQVSPSRFFSLLEEAWQRGQGKGVRLIGISVALPDPDDDRQLELDLE